jgi:hypothetical protein
MWAEPNRQAKNKFDFKTLYNIMTRHTAYRKISSFPLSFLPPPRRRFQLFITNVKGMFFGMSDSGEAYKGRFRLRAGILRWIL